MTRIKLQKGDKVKVMAGKDRGKEGVVEKIWSKTKRATIPGINMFKRHLKARGEGQRSGIIDIVRPLPIANLALICPKCKQVTRIGYKLTQKEKIRVCRKCDQEV